MSQFEAKYDEFQAMGAQIVGISVDSHYCHAAFATRLSLRFPLLSDFNREIVGDFAGLSEHSKGYRDVSVRRILVLDRLGTVRWQWTASPSDAAPDTEKVREAVQDIVYVDASND